jgi:hypothetical protein
MSDNSTGERIAGMQNGRRMERGKDIGYGLYGGYGLRFTF